MKNFKNFILTEKIQKVLSGGWVRIKIDTSIKTIYSEYNEDVSLSKKIIEITNLKPDDLNEFVIISIVSDLSGDTLDNVSNNIKLNDIEIVKETPYKITSDSLYIYIDIVDGVQIAIISKSIKKSKPRQKHGFDFEDELFLELNKIEPECFELTKKTTKWDAIGHLPSIDKFENINGKNENDKIIYRDLGFYTSFKNKKSAVETITAMLDKDGEWRVSGYFIIRRY